MKTPYKRELQQIAFNHSSDIDFKDFINCNTILTEKQQKYHLDKYEYLTGKEIIPPDQRRVIEQAKFAYSSLGKAFEKQTKTIEEQGKKQVGVLEILKREENKEDIKSDEGSFPKGMRTNEIKNRIDKIKKWEEKVKQQDLIYKENKYKYNFQQY